MALTKAQVLALSEPVEKMYSDCTSQLIINICKHFATGRGLATQAWEAQKLAEMGQLNDESIEIIAANTGQKAEKVRKALYDGIKTGLADEEALLQNAAEKGYIATAAGMLETSMQVRNLVDAYAAQAEDQLNLVNTVMLQSTQNRYMLAVQQVVNAEEAAKIEALTSAGNAVELAQQMGKAQRVLNSATGSVLLGNEARTKALRGAIKTLADNGITGFIDAGGHHWTPEAYVNMDIRTTVGNVTRQAQKTRAAEYGVDTFQVSSHAAARPLCAPYQGWICSWSSGGYTVEDLYGNSYMVHNISETSYGEPAGLFGINCGHNPLTFVPGFSVPRVSELTPEQEQENALQYAQSQQQRYLEREVRHAKTEALAYEAAGDKEGFALAAAKVKQTQTDYMAFCGATDRTPRTDRLQVFGYNRSVSAKATAATRGYKPEAKPIKMQKPVAVQKSASYNGGMQDIQQARKIYEKNTGQRYNVTNGDTVTLWHQAGATAPLEPAGEFVAPKNNTSGVVAYGMPSQSSAQYLDATQNTILTNGRVALNYNAANNNTRQHVKDIINNEMYALVGVREDGVFYRVIGSDKEIGYIQNGTIRASTNHMTGEKELGLSVWELPKYAGKTVKLSGNVIDIGSDGEPVLDLRSIKYLGIYDPAGLQEVAIKAFSAKYDWTEQQVVDALTGKIKIER